MIPSLARQIGLLHYPEGLSAHAMLKVKLGIKDGPFHHPHDPSDLARCIRAHGEVVPDYMEGITPTWAAYVKAWPELIDTFNEEWAEDTERAPRTYEMMKAIMESANK